MPLNIKIFTFHTNIHTKILKYSLHTNRFANIWRFKVFRNMTIEYIRLNSINSNSINIRFLRPEKSRYHWWIKERIKWIQYGPHCPLNKNSLMTYKVTTSLEKYISFSDVGLLSLALGKEVKRISSSLANESRFISDSEINVSQVSFLSFMTLKIT